ncbi:MAG: DNA gyrase subunit A [Chitinispirillia bacterium]|jgi:DNA gyrase subunit A
MSNPDRKDYVLIEDEMQKSYLDYSMSMITSRALPDVRDGLKPVHRRVLYGLNELGLFHNRQPKKCARVVGDVIGKYHPHGDAAVYETLVRMAQDFSLRYCMVNGQGNFGSVDGDPAAAMRYTECRMTRLSEEMLTDIEKETVDFVSNYDDSLKEPSVLPSKIPYLLLNGSTGIAVGMATNMAPHNLQESLDAIIAVIDNPAINLEELLNIIPGPDFPTGGVIYGKTGIWQAYKTGRGKIIVRAKYHTEKLPQDREQIIITEIPYMVNKSSLLEKMADLMRQKTIDGISDIRDESDRSGMRIVIVVKKDSFSDVVLNQLFKFTNLQTTFGINNLALVNMQPNLLTLKDLLNHFIDHRHDVVERRTKFELRKASDRAHILEGLRIALQNIDEIIAIIKNSPSPQAADTVLRERFNLSEKQTKAILEMRLQRLTGLERDKIEEEYSELLKLISYLKSVLESREKRMGIIREELLEIKKKFSDPRRTEIIESDGDVDIDIEDMIANEDMVITMTHGGYIKRCHPGLYRSQGRGGRGVKGMDSKGDDFVETVFVASTHSYILFFTNKGRCYWLKVYRVPESGRQSKGRPIVNLLNLRQDEKIASFVPVKEFDTSHYIVAATEKGIINKQPLIAYSRVRRDGINAINLDDDDRLITCKLTDGDNDIVIGTKNGTAVRFHESVMREIGRNTRGVKGITLRPGDQVIDMIIVKENDNILSVTENGFGKQTPVSEYRRTNRGGKGIINIKTTKRNGYVVGMKNLKADSDIIIITRKGIIIRSDGSKVSLIGRNTQGVKLIHLNENDSVIDVTICEKQNGTDDELGEDI